MLHEIAEHRTCTQCTRSLPVDQFHFLSKPKNQRMWECRDCKNDRTRTYQRANRHPAIKYGISVAEFDAMWEQQGYACATCRCTEPKGSRYWQIDHDHKCCPPPANGRKACGKCVRGILCSHCNVALGMVADDPSLLIRLASYLGGK